MPTAASTTTASETSTTQGRAPFHPPPSSSRLSSLTEQTLTSPHSTSNYPFYLDTQQRPTIQRRWFPDPIQSVSHPYLACNRGNPLANLTSPLHAPIRAGDNITAYYIAPPCPSDLFQPVNVSVPGGFNEPTPVFRCAGPEYPWVHSLGPMLVYMAACPGSSCEGFHPGAGDRVWFKVYEAGFHPGTDVYGDEVWERDVATTRAWDQFTFANKGW